MAFSVFSRFLFKLLQKLFSNFIVEFRKYFKLLFFSSGSGRVLSNSFCPLTGKLNKFHFEILDSVSGAGVEGCVITSRSYYFRADVAFELSIFCF